LHIYLDFKFRGRRQRNQSKLLTGIKNENLEYCKKLEEIAHIEIRHMDGVKGNFTILDSKELLITDFIDKLGVLL
jgi:hypothetical protein